MLYLKYKNIIDKNNKSCLSLFVGKMSSIESPSIALNQGNSSMVVTLGGDTATITPIDPTHAYCNESALSYNFNCGNNGLPESVTVASTLDPNWERTYPLNWSNVNAIESDPESKSPTMPQSDAKAIEPNLASTPKEIIVMVPSYGYTDVPVAVPCDQEGITIHSVKVSFAPNGACVICISIQHRNASGELKTFYSKTQGKEVPLVEKWCLFITEPLAQGEFGRSLTSKVTTPDGKGKIIPSTFVVTLKVETTIQPFPRKDTQNSTSPDSKKSESEDALKERLLFTQTALKEAYMRISQLEIENRDLVKQLASQSCNTTHSCDENGHVKDKSVCAKPNFNPRPKDHKCITGRGGAGRGRGDGHSIASKEANAKSCRNCGNPWSKGHNCENVIKSRCKRCDMEYTGSIREHDLGVCTKPLAPPLPTKK